MNATTLTSRADCDAWLKSLPVDSFIISNESVYLWRKASAGQWYDLDEKKVYSEEWVSMYIVGASSELRILFWVS